MFQAAGIDAQLLSVSLKRLYSWQDQCQLEKEISWKTADFGVQLSLDESVKRVDIRIKGLKKKQKLETYQKQNINTKQGETTTTIEQQLNEAVFPLPLDGTKSVLQYV